MSSHIDSSDAVASDLGDVMVTTGPVELTRRQLRAAAEAAAQSDAVLIAAGAVFPVHVESPPPARRRERERLRSPHASEAATTQVSAAAVAAPVTILSPAVETAVQPTVEPIAQPTVEPVAQRRVPTDSPTRRSSRRASSPQQEAPQTAPPRSAPPRGMSETASRPHKRRRNTARFLSVTAMVFVAAIAVATSVPANALLTAQDVEALNGAQNQEVVTVLKDAQSVEASGENVMAGRDGVSVSAAEPVKAFVSSSSNRISPIVPNSTGPILWPFATEVPLTDSFGPRVGFWTYGGFTGNFHSGQDFDPGYGVPIQSIADGIVTEVSSSLCGQAVVISHNVNGEKFESQYCHMIYGSPNVTVGQSITAGTIIGNVGQTGMSTGPHLHLEIHISGNAVDPMGFLRARV